MSARKVFANRDEAALELAGALAGYRGACPLVLAIPRGAVPMGRIIADQLEGELDVVLTRKLRAPGNPEFAIGSIDESGWAYVADYAPDTGATDDYIEQEKLAQLEAIHRRRVQYTPVRPPISPEERIVIVVDDGLATGSTMMAALHGLRGRNPRKLICAVPVAPPETVEKIGRLADEVVCLLSPEGFYAVGQFYQEFPQVDDAEVIAALASSPRG